MSKTTETIQYTSHQYTHTVKKRTAYIDPRSGNVLLSPSPARRVLLSDVSIEEIDRRTNGNATLNNAIFHFERCLNTRNCICFRANGRWIPASAEEIADHILHKSVRQTYRILRDLERSGLIQSEPDPRGALHYYLSPVIANYGTWTTPEQLYRFEQDFLAYDQIAQGPNSRNAVLTQLQRPDPVMPDTPEQIFHDLLLRGEPPKLYTKRGNGMVRYDYDTIRSDVPIFFLVNGMGYYKETKPKNEDMTVHDILMLDFDIEKSEDPDKTAKDVEAALQKLPPCTVKVHSGHGIHVYWKLAESLPADAWKNLQTRLAQSIPHADTAVKDASRVMRYPGSYNRKDPDDPRLVRILEARRVMYDSQDIEQALTRSFPVPVQYTTVSRPAPVPKVYTDSRRIADIRNGVLIRVPHTPRVFESKKDLIAYTHTLDLSEFLQLPIGPSFSCIFHEDTHPSAYLISQETDHDMTYKYFCQGSRCCVSTEAKGFDMIELVQRLQGVSFSKALSYIAAVYEIST